MPVLLLVALGLLAAPALAQDHPPAAASDVESLDAIIAALYDVISGEVDEERDWDRFRSLLHPQARLIPTGARPDGSHAAAVLTPQDYVERAGPQLTAGGFWERELHRETDRFGNVAQVFSTYEARVGSPDADPTMRGINSIQLYHDGARWWVLSVLWQNESEAVPVPPTYLPSGG